jgi:hypothetical protein
MNQKTEDGGTSLTQDFVRPKVHCSICKVEASGDVLLVKLGEHYQFPWLRLPSGWWMALPGTFTNGVLDIICRCPQCLRVGPSVATTLEAFTRENRRRRRRQKTTAKTGRKVQP